MVYSSIQDFWSSGKHMPMSQETGALGLAVTSCPLVWPGIVPYSLLEHTGVLPSIPDQIKEARLGDSWHEDYERLANYWRLF